MKQSKNILLDNIDIMLFENATDVEENSTKATVERWEEVSVVSSTLYVLKFRNNWLHEPKILSFFTTGVLARFTDFRSTYLHTTYRL
jgi:hypothetical protein